MSAYINLEMCPITTSPTKAVVWRVYIVYVTGMLALSVLSVTLVHLVHSVPEEGLERYTFSTRFG